jgi:hypothetical protein
MLGTRPVCGHVLRCQHSQHACATQFQRSGGHVSTGHQIRHDKAKILLRKGAVSLQLSLHERSHLDSKQRVGLRTWPSTKAFPSDVSSKVLEKKKKKKKKQHKTRNLTNKPSAQLDHGDSKRRVLRVEAEKHNEKVERCKHAKHGVTTSFRFSAIRAQSRQQHVRVGGGETTKQIVQRNDTVFARQHGKILHHQTADLLRNLQRTLVELHRRNPKQTGLFFPFRLTDSRVLCSKVKTGKAR